MTWVSILLVLGRKYTTGYDTYDSSHWCAHYLDDSFKVFLLLFKKIFFTLAQMICFASPMVAGGLFFMGAWGGGCVCVCVCVYEGILWLQCLSGSRTISTWGKEKEDFQSPEDQLSCLCPHLPSIFPSMCSGATTGTGVHTNHIKHLNNVSQQLFVV